MTAAFVLDTSLTLTWCFPDERTERTDRLLHRMVSETALVPSLWFLEVANGLLSGERKGRITRRQADEFVRLASGFDLEVDDRADRRMLPDLHDLGWRQSLTSYDALYLDLAIRSRLPLATTDEPLAEAAERMGVQLLLK